MNLSINVVRFLSALVAVTWVTGCGGGFKSKTYSDQEIANYRANLNAKKNADDPRSAPPMDPPGDGSKTKDDGTKPPASPPGGDAGKAPAAPATPAPAAPGGDKGGAQTGVLVEPASGYS